MLQSIGPPNWPLHLLMDKAYEGDETRQLALDLGFIPLSRQKAIALNHGNTIRKCTNVETKWSDYSEDLKASAASSRDSTNWM